MLDGEGGGGGKNEKSDIFFAPLLPYPLFRLSSNPLVELSFSLQFSNAWNFTMAAKLFTIEHTERPLEKTSPALQSRWVFDNLTLNF